MAYAARENTSPKPSWTWGKRDYQTSNLLDIHLHRREEKSWGVLVKVIVQGVRHTKQLSPRHQIIECVSSTQTSTRSPYNAVGHSWKNGRLRLCWRRGFEGKWKMQQIKTNTLVSCIQPGLVICFTLDNIHVSMLFSWNIPPSPCKVISLQLIKKLIN